MMMNFIFFANLRKKFVLRKIFLMIISNYA